MTNYMGEGEKDRLADRVLGWISSGTKGGWFRAREIISDLKLKDERERVNLRKVLSRLAEKNIIERDLKLDGRYRYLDSSCPTIEWEGADVSKTITIEWPKGFNIGELVTLYPKNLVVVAGAPNAGKTALLLNLVKLNMQNHKILYFTSEMGAEEMKLRLSKFELEKWNFVAKERSMNYAEVIHPNKINIIDFLEVTTDFYAIADELNAIFRKLDEGVAIVAIQKKIGAQLGRGAEFSLEKPRLYLSMDNSRLKIVKAKNWAQAGVNPNGKEWTFQLVGGAKFVNIMEAT